MGKATRHFLIARRDRLDRAAHGKPGVGVWLVVSRETDERNVSTFGVAPLHRLAAPLAAGGLHALSGSTPPPLSPFTFQNGAKTAWQRTGRDPPSIRLLCRRLSCPHPQPHLTPVPVVLKLRDLGAWGGESGARRTSGHVPFFSVRIDLAKRIALRFPPSSSAAPLRFWGPLPCLSSYDALSVRP